MGYTHFAAMSQSKSNGNKVRRPRPPLHKVVILAVIATALLLPAAAQANWGPGGECARPDSHHCYSTTWLLANDLGSIIQVEDEDSVVYDWAEGGFETQEEWITWPNKYGSNAWVEVGQIIGHGASCCTPHPFQFEQTPAGVDHALWPEAVPNPGYADYLLYDTEGKGLWTFYYGSPGGTNSQGQPDTVEGWYPQGYQWGGWPLRYEETEAGTEIGSESQPIDNGRDAVARWINGSSPWYPWNGYGWNEENSFCRNYNQDLNAPGNQEWSVGCFK
jgi:hypothetical protein